MATGRPIRTLEYPVSPFQSYIFFQPPTSLVQTLQACLLHRVYHHDIMPDVAQATRPSRTKTMGNGLAGGRLHPSLPW